MGEIRSLALSLALVMGCQQGAQTASPSPATRRLCEEITNLQVEVIDRHLSALSIETECAASAASVAFVEGYLQGLDRGWVAAFRAAGDDEAATLPALAEPITGYHVAILGGCARQPGPQLAEEVSNARAAILERIAARQGVCAP